MAKTTSFTRDDLVGASTFLKDMALRVKTISPMAQSLISTQLPFVDMLESPFLYARQETPYLAKDLDTIAMALDMHIASLPIVPKPEVVATIDPTPVATPTTPLKGKVKKGAGPIDPPAPTTPIVVKAEETPTPKADTPKPAPKGKAALAALASTALASVTTTPTPAPQVETRVAALGEAPKADASPRFVGEVSHAPKATKGAAPKSHTLGYTIDASEIVKHASQDTRPIVAKADAPKGSKPKLYRTGKVS